MLPLSPETVSVQPVFAECRALPEK
jgi:hypothetical protein